VPVSKSCVAQNAPFCGFLLAGSLLAGLLLCDGLIPGGDVAAVGPPISRSLVDPPYHYCPFYLKFVNCVVVGKGGVPRKLLRLNE